MRARSLIGAVSLAAGLAGGPATASHEPTTEYFTFRTTTACAFACSYWTDFATRRHACAQNPIGPPGSWDERRITIPSVYAGGTPLAIRLRIFPTVEYDSFICRVNDPGTPVEEWEIANMGANFPSDGSCTQPDAGVGCSESISVNVEPEEVYVLRAYNFSDATFCPAELTWFVS